MTRILLCFTFTLLILVFLSVAWASTDNITSAGTRIEISGVSAEIKTNIELHLGVNKELIPNSTLGFPRSAEYIRAKAKLALQALGYYRPTISLSRTQQQNDQKQNEWTLTIELNQATQWHQIDLQLQGPGSDYQPLIQIVKKHPFTKGLTVNHGTYEQYKNQLLQRAIESGFLDAQFEISRMDINVSKSIADVKWLLKTGARYYLGKVELSGSSLSQAFLRKYLFVQPKEIYQYENIIKSQQALNRSGYFNLVTIDQTVNRETYLVDITIALQDIEKYEFKTTLGYGTDTGGKIGVSWLDRQVNDRGHNYLLSIDSSKIETITAFQYKIPLDNQKSAWLNRVSYRIKDDNLARSKISAYESRLINQINEHWSSQWALALATENITTDSSIISNLNYLIPSWQTNYYSVTDPFSAQTGWRWMSEIHFGAKQLSEPDIEFFQIEQNIKSIWALSEDWRLLFRGRAGFTKMNIEHFNTSMPTDFRYFAGGDVSVRGYDYQSLAPKDIDSLILGGKHLLTSSLELDWQFSSNWRWAVFTDQGNAFNDWQDIDIHRSVGTGLRWITPVGSVRLDLAKALDGQEDLSWHITIGPDL